MKICMVSVHTTALIPPFHRNLIWKASSDYFWKEKEEREEDVELTIEV